jgi:hypothetical protein
MADLVIEDNELVLKLSTIEKAEGLHKDLRAPLDSIVSVEILEDAHKAAGELGFKIGTRLPRVIEVASVYNKNGKFFAAVHSNTRRGIRIHFKNMEFSSWIVGLRDPESKVKSLGLMPS